MIVVNDKYGVVVSNTDYAVVRRSGKLGKDGKEQLGYMTYHDSLGKAINRIGKFVVQDELVGKDMTLAEAAERIETAVESLKLKIGCRIPEVKVVK